ncbi:uncharacterized protein LACBIDRAFT_308846 [Laccaria bicolor S238N-H82]|uniref:Predicted protein n=1 Tax=Laccaria bicolor (strain S238N-H82 / ATCC MYA-4686) TaxID=486041 RepID=B0CXC2_LACBS|nr:uncharacterized protein LACBIDRAFT_308846 [Laccaria bicolor S238N-H82]EDR13232.1 predicted protein [Laccaria bicolor S238N-H82]|eukprot:XP_001875730.1 predicted protein [Laccaria bicolor S238N-H82]
MPFFQGASGITISGGEFNDIAGDFTKTDSSVKTTNTDSYNTTSETLTNSNNDNSQRLTVDPAKKVKPVKQGKKSGVR